VSLSAEPESIIDIDIEGVSPVPRSVVSAAACSSAITSKGKFKPDETLIVLFPARAVVGLA
jgi:hypothetical protein